jgi:type I restriction enzyme S subunit
MNTEKRLIPLLRFPDYQNEREWQAIELGEIGDVCMCKRIMKDETSQNGDIPFFKIGTFGKVADAFISAQLFLEYKAKYSYPSKGDILFSAAGTIGRCVEFDGHPAYFQDSNIVWIANNEKLVYNSFLKYVYSIVKWNIDDGGVVKRLYNDSIKKTRILIPTLPEQQKIAECLSSIDTYISSINEKVEQLKAHKKSLLQKLFPQKGQTAPEFRFSEFEKNGSWEEKELGELIVEIAEFTSRGNNVPLYSLTIEDGVSPKTDRYERNFLVKKEGDNFKVVYPYDFVSNPMNLRFGAIGYNKDSFKVCVSGYYDVFRFKDKGTSSFWINYMKSNWALDMYDRIATGSLYEKRRVHFSNLLRMKLLVPKYSERLKISEYLSSMDEVISLYSKKASLLEQHKKGLMQQLFPKA